MLKLLKIQIHSGCTGSNGHNHNIINLVTTPTRVYNTMSCRGIPTDKFNWRKNIMYILLV